jgi:hypothetical protein
MNFSALMPRSAAWPVFSSIFNPSYPDEMSCPLLLGLAQILWDRGETNGYAHVMTSDRQPDTPQHKVLMDVAFSDHVVSNWQSNVMARTIGARAVNPLVYANRWDGVGQSDDFELSGCCRNGYEYLRAGRMLCGWINRPLSRESHQETTAIGSAPQLR